MSVSHDSSYHEQVLANARGGVEDMGVPYEVFDIAMLIRDLVDMLPHCKGGFTGESLESWAQLCYVVQFSKY